MTQIEFDEKMKALAQALDDVFQEANRIQNELTAGTDLFGTAGELAHEQNPGTVGDVVQRLLNRTECSVLLTMAGEAISSARFAFTSARGKAMNI